jgi:hypothetical protein
MGGHSSLKCSLRVCKTSYNKNKVPWVATAAWNVPKKVCKSTYNSKSVPWVTTAAYKRNNVPWVTTGA